MNIFRKTAIAMLALAGVALGAEKAEAAIAPGYAAYNVNLMAGPGNYYPVLLTIPRGSRLAIYGCFDDWSWCDVSLGYERGWVVGPLIRAFYYERPVFLPQYGGILGIPFLSFNFFVYWDDHYRSRPFYRDYNRYFQFYDRDGRRGIDHRRDDDRGRNNGQGPGGNRYPGFNNNNDHRSDNDDLRFVPGQNGGAGNGNPGNGNNGFNGRNDDARRFVPGQTFGNPGNGNQGNGNPGNNNGRNDDNARRFVPGQTFGNPGNGNPGNIGNPGNGNPGNNGNNDRRFVPGQNGNPGNGNANKGNGCQPGTHPTANGCVADNAGNGNAGGNGPDGFRGRGR